MTAGITVTDVHRKGKSGLGEFDNNFELAAQTREVDVGKGNWASGSHL